ncbi:DUF6932 family protein [Micromonospora sp. CA-259024]|uniref:DUF6932 family protein n=1 Tax=Micromonospora sp. CA-259024 TaxID=3239965 RepID=UPI003D8FAEE4
MLGPNGFLPPGRHIVTIDEFRSSFVESFPGSRSRRSLFERWLQHRDAISGIAPIQYQWIDGSFATHKENPRDVDVVTFLMADDVDRLSPGKKMLLDGLFNGHETRDRWGIDSFLSPVVAPGDPRSSVARKMAGKWLKFFTGVREDDTLVKGILEVKDGQ